MWRVATKKVTIDDVFYIFVSSLPYIPSSVCHLGLLQVLLFLTVSGVKCNNETLMCVEPTARSMHMSARWFGMYVV